MHSMLVVLLIFKLLINFLDYYTISIVYYNMEVVYTKKILIILFFNYLNDKFVAPPLLTFLEKKS